MIDFQRFDLSRKEEYEKYLHSVRRGCEYSFTNLNLWGRQRAAFLEGYLVLFSQFERRSVYPFPVGSGDIKPVLDAIVHDARSRGIVCRLTGMTAEDCMILEELYPGQFQLHPDRNGCDYVYDIHDLADLPGRRYQKKRNHLNKFRLNHPDCTIQSITAENMSGAEELVSAWYAQRENSDEYHLEQVALKRAFANMDALGLEGIVLEEKGRLLAMAMGSRLFADTFDIHFEKALDEEAYPAINQAFAAYLREKHPTLRYLDREDDMGLPGLRKAKLSYHPHHMITKFWARLWEEDDES